MELTEVAKHLITGLHLFGVERDAIVGIPLILEKEEQQIELMEWMANHREIIGQGTKTTVRIPAESGEK